MKWYEWKWRNTFIDAVSQVRHPDYVGARSVAVLKVVAHLLFLAVLLAMIALGAYIYSQST